MRKTVLAATLAVLSAGTAVYTSNHFSDVPGDHPHRADILEVSNWQGGTDERLQTVTIPLDKEVDAVRVHLTMDGETIFEGELNQWEIAQNKDNAVMANLDFRSTTHTS